ncbi:SRPBCC family protein [Nocardioides limicola]|uniref:SRPBCC family protein n=1 Tax=Nocardioides limicola TaxID=2803368 RepID=UPI00193B8B64|nr:SRPBCC family protein [Nocardioides sp. DJM-14]
MRTFDLAPIDLGFFTDAPISYRMDVHLPVAPAVAWGELTRQNTLDWCRVIRKIEFTSPAPYGVGTTRQAALGPGFVSLSEVFFDWNEDAEAGRYRNAFQVERSTVPGMKRFGELTEVQPAEVGCRLIWTFALELPSNAAPVTAFSAPTAAKVFRTVENDTIRHFATFTPRA